MKKKNENIPVVNTMTCKKNDFVPQMWDKTLCSKCFLSRDKHPDNQGDSDVESLFDESNNDMGDETSGIEDNIVDDLADVQEKLELRNKESDELRQKLNAAEIRLEEKEKELQEKEKELQEKSNNISSLTAALKRRESEKNPKASALAAMQQRLKQATKAHESQTRELENAKKRLSMTMKDGNNVSLTNMQSRLSATLAQNKRLEEKLSKEQQDMKEMEKIVRQLEFKMDEAEQAAKSVKDQVQMLAQENILLEDALSNRVYASSTDESKEMLESMEREVKKKQSKIEELEEETNQQKQVIELLEKENQLLDDALQSKIVALAQKAQNQDKSSEFDRILAGFETQLAKKEKQIKKLKRDNDILRKRQTNSNNMLAPRQKTFNAAQSRASLFVCCREPGCDRTRSLGSDRCKLHCKPEERISFGSLDPVSEDADDEPEKDEDDDVAKILSDITGVVPVTHHDKLLRGFEDSQDEKSGPMFPFSPPRTTVRLDLSGIKASSLPSPKKIPSKLPPIKFNKEPEVVKKKIVKPKVHHTSSKSRKKIPKKKHGIPLNKNDVEYVDEDELKGVSDPKALLAKSSKKLKCGNWREEFNALDDIRTLIIHHSEVVIPVLSDILDKVGEQLANLRSSIVKNALLCLRACFLKFGPGGLVDKFFHRLIQPLIRCATDGNRFLAQEGNETLEVMVDCINRKKVLKELIIAIEMRAPAQKAKALQYIAQCTKLMGPAIVDQHLLDPLIRVLPPLLYANAPECRTHAQSTVKNIGYSCAKAGPSAFKELNSIANRHVQSNVRDRWDKALNAGKEMAGPMPKSKGRKKKKKGRRR